MNAVEETWRRSKLDTQVCERHGSLGGMKKRLVEYFRTTRFNLDLFTYVNPVWSAEFFLASSAYLREGIWAVVLILSKSKCRFYTYCVVLDSSECPLERLSGRASL
jgi:hypothetical protein